MGHLTDEVCLDNTSLIDAKTHNSVYLGSLNVAVRNGNLFLFTCVAYTSIKY